MFLTLHIIVALSGLAASSYTAFRPSYFGLKASGTLLVATLASGTVLVAGSHASLRTACLSGLAYSGFCLAAIGFGWKKLASQDSRVRR